MGRLTEIIEAVNTPAADLNRELYTHIDLDAMNDDIIEARKIMKQRQKPQGTLFDME